MVMALSAASPAVRGYLLDVDCRWGIISSSVDDRTEEERGEKVCTLSALLTMALPLTRLMLLQHLNAGWFHLFSNCLVFIFKFRICSLLKPLDKDKYRIPKSRYDSVSSYISPAGDAYNDTDIPYDKKAYKELIEEGEHSLCSHLNLTRMFHQKIAPL